MRKLLLGVSVVLACNDVFALSMPGDSMRVGQIQSDIQMKKKDLVSACSLQEALIASIRQRLSQLLAHSYLLARVLRLRNTYGGEGTPQQEGYLKLTLAALLRGAAQEEAKAIKAFDLFKAEQERLQAADTVFRFKMRFFLEKFQSPSHESKNDFSRSP